VNSGFRRDVDEICALLGYYAASSGNPLPTFPDNVSVPSSRVRKLTYRPLKMGPICSPETSIKDYHSTLRNIPEECRSHQFRSLHQICVTLLTVCNIDMTTDDLQPAIRSELRTVGSMDQ
jgi:hypothetical protein